MISFYLEAVDQFPACAAEAPAMSSTKRKKEYFSSSSLFEMVGAESPSLVQSNIE
jgi:hypothetical protein